MMTALDLNFARNILTSIMSCSLTGITSHFMYPIDPVREKLKGYNIIIKDPICMSEMLQRIKSDEYQSIKEFVCDFRLMLYNFYRYFGCDSKMGKCAAKLEAMFEQKLLLLPIDVRVRTSMDAILTDDENQDALGMSRRRCSDRSHNSDVRMVTPIKAIIDELENCGTISTLFSDNVEFRNDPINYLTLRLQKWREKRRDLQLIRGFDEWYIINTSEYDRNVLDTCSEFVELLQFISLGYYATGLDQLLLDHMKIDHITPEDVRFAILFPCSSNILAAIVTLLITKSKNRLFTLKGPLPNYNQWNKELANRVSFLYTQWCDKRLSETPNVFLKRFNIDPILFKVLGPRRSPLFKKQFHELSVFQRCHLLLAMCYMTLRGCEYVHAAIEKSIEWEDHQRIVLGRIGDIEYVRFSGLGEYSSFYIYRMKALEMDEELSSYSAPDVADQIKRKKNTKPLDKYRVPNWHAKEVKKLKTKKSNASLRSKKRKSILDIPECDQMTPSTTLLDTSKPNDDAFIDINEDSVVTKCSSDIGTPKVDPNQSEHASVTTNDEDPEMIESNEPGLSAEYNETLDSEEIDIPEICEPTEGALTILATDLWAVTGLISDMKEKMKSATNEEQESYEALVARLVEVRTFFEENESARLEKMDECKLRLRRAVMEFEEREKAGKLQEMPSGADEEDESTEQMSDLERRTWEPARKKARVANGAPPEAVAGDVAGGNAPTVKKKVFQIYNDFFTDDLLPVRVREDGSLESLPLDLVSEERYALARKMIDLYRLKYGLAPVRNGGAVAHRAPGGTADYGGRQSPP